MEIAEQLKTGLTSAKKVDSISASASRLIFCGMGGSMMPAEALTMLWLDHPTVYLNRTAYLPHWASPEHIVVCISWSGNTEETIACFQEALQKNIPVWVITTGGKLAELSQIQQVPTVILPAHGLNPRDALPAMFSALLTLLNQAGLVRSYLTGLTLLNSRPAAPTPSDLTGLTLVSRSDIIENSIDSSSFNPTIFEDLAKNLAAKIGPKTPLLYSSYPWRFLGQFWKIFFNENTKIHSFFNFLPGAGHNEIAGIKKEDPSFFYLLLRDPQDHVENLKKIDQFEKFLKSYGVGHEVITLSGRNRLEQILNQYLLASTVSTALAHYLGVDPHSTETIENFKHLS